MAKSTVAVKFTGDVSGLKGAIGDVDGKLSGLGSKIGTVAKGAALGFAAIGGAAVVGAKSAIDAASNLNETMSKSNTVFKESAGQIMQWAQTAASSFGQSKQQALEAASSFGNMFTQLGIGADQAADMSMQMTELASDFASFHNADISEVLAAQEAAFRGEYDSVQKFVPTINAAAVEQKALAMGLGKTTKELDAQDKALATQALMLEGAGDAMGDFDRTNDGLANKQRILSATFEDLKAKIGGGLLPIVTTLADVFLTRVMPVFDEVGGAVRAFFAAFSAGDGEITSDGLAGKFEEFGNRLREVFNAVGPVVQSFIETIVSNWPRIQAVISQVMATVGSVITGAVSIISTVWDNFGNNILELIQRVFPAIQQTIEGAMNIIQGIIKTVTALIRGDWSGVWDGIKQVFSGVWSVIQGIVKTALEVMRTAIGVGLEVVGSIIKGAWNGILDYFKSIPGKIGGFFSGLAEILTAPYRIAFNAIKSLWNSTIGGFGFEFGGWDPPGPGSVPGIKFRIPEMHTGGMVPGGASNEPIYRLQGGERVLSRSEVAAQERGSGGGLTIVVQGNVFDGRELAQHVVDGLRTLGKEQGLQYLNVR